MSRPERSVTGLASGHRIRPSRVATETEVPTIPGLLEVATSYFDRFARPDLAMVILEKILEVEPEYAPALTLAGRIAAGQGAEELAETLLTRAIALSPFDADPRRHLAALWIGRGRLEESLAILGEAAAVAPREAAVHFEIGTVLVSMGEPERAAEAFRAALARDPRCDRALRALVVLDMEARRFALAADRYRSLLRREGLPVRGQFISAGTVGSIRDWCAVHDSPYRVTGAAAGQALYPPRFAGEPEPEVVMVERPETYVAEIADATVIGGESLVIAGTGEVLWDLAVHPRGDRFDLTERVLKFAAGGAALVNAGTTTHRRVDAAVHLLGVSSFNYFHWMIEVLPRLANLEAAYPETDYAGLPLLVDSASLAVPQHVAVLRSIVGPAREIIAVEREAALRVGRLIVPSQLAWLSNNLKDGLEIEAEDVLISEEAVRFLRDRLTPSDVLRRRRETRRGTRRIHLVKPVSKRLMNAAELAPVLEKYSLEPVMPERMSVEDQVRLFADVDVLVCETGAGLTNLVYAPETARVVVMTGSATWRPTWFSQIAGILGQSMTYVAGQVTAPHQKTYQSCFTIDPAVLDSALAEVLGEPAGQTDG